MAAEEFTDEYIKGLQNMILLLMLMVLIWAFAAVNVALGFTEFITGTNWECT